MHHIPYPPLSPHVYHKHRPGHHSPNAGLHPHPLYADTMLLYRTARY